MIAIPVRVSFDEFSSRVQRFPEGPTKHLTNKFGSYAPVNVRFPWKTEHDLVILEVIRSAIKHDQWSLVPLVFVTLSIVITVCAWAHALIPLVPCLQVHWNFRISSKMNNSLIREYSFDWCDVSFNLISPSNLRYTCSLFLSNSIWLMQILLQN